jgi:CBS domain containing-hemolysin-like protein
MIRLFGENGDLYAFLIYTPIFLILGEIVPKSVYQQNADSIAPRIIFALKFFLWLFYPIVFIFSRIARLIARLAGVKMETRELFVNREQIRTVIEMAERGANIDVFDRDRIMRVTQYADLTVGQAMIPISETTTLDSQQTTRDAIQIARTNAHFRLPVYEGVRNQVIGAVCFTMWDLMNPALAEQPLSELIKPTLYVTANQMLDDLLPVLQHRNDHMAIVVDEFGSAIGMITLEDILNEVVGEVINVGYTFEGYMPRRKYQATKLENGSFLMDARTPIIEANSILGISIPPMESHTIGGMVISHLHRMPEQGDSVTQAGYRFIVESMSVRGIQQLRVEPDR